MPFCERLARTGFQIFLEGHCLFFFLESKVGDEFSRNEFGSMRRIAAVVAEKALFEIVREPDVLFAWMGFRSEEVGVVHFCSAVLFGGDTCYLAGLPAVAWVAGGSAFAKATADAPAFAWRCASSEGWSG